MKRRIGMIIAGLALGAALIVGERAAAAGDESGTLIVTAVGFQSTDGTALFAIYEGGKSWLDMDGAYRIEKVDMGDARVKKGSVRVTFRNLPYGEYGVAVLHDANDNGEMDMQWLPYPKPQEDAGVSNNWVRNGKPKYEKARFDFDRRIMSLRIKMRR